MRKKRKSRSLNFWGHLHEARGRLISSAAAWVAVSMALFFYRETVFAMVAAPAGPLHYLGPADALMAQLKICFGLGFILVLPYLSWHIWAFISPALEPGLARRLGGAVCAAVILFWIGVALGYSFLQQGLRFLAEYQLPGLQPTLTVDRYLGFLMSLCLACGVVFEMPVAVYWLARNELLSQADLKYRWREAILGSMLLAAVLTPSPDVFSQLFLFLPLMMLYGISVWVAGWASPSFKTVPSPWRPGK